MSVFIGLRVYIFQTGSLQTLHAPLPVLFIYRIHKCHIAEIIMYQTSHSS
jgi:hypothetical protein